MADNYQPPNGWLGKLRGSGSEARQRFEEDARQRTAEGKRSDSIILNQKDVLTGNWDANKVLFTTLGGKLRPITVDDLAAFRRNIATAQSRMAKGITAKQVIDWSSGIVWHSSKSDLERARTEIKMAIPVSAQNGRVRFITNAGPESDVTRHHVVVEFLNYGAEASSGVTDPRKAAMRLRKGPLKIDCDCGRFRYFFRYIATIGGFNAGRAEVGLPKIKNPRLQGIACKHIVRVMSDVNSGPVTLQYLTKLMEKAKSSDDAKAKLALKQAAADKIAKNQSRRTGSIKTSEQKRQERLAAQSRKSAASAVKKAVPPKKVKKPSKTETKDAAAVLAQKFGLTPEQVLALLAQQKG